jgi:SRSO17 transposase
LTRPLLISTHKIGIGFRPAKEPKENASTIGHGNWAWQRLGRLQVTPEDHQWGHWLLVRRSIESPQQLDYYVVFGPAQTTLAEVVGVAGARWNIETCFKTLKGQFGLDQYEVRRWDAWHRFITLALLAHAFVSVMRAVEGEKVEGEKGAQKLA